MTDDNIIEPRVLNEILKVAVRVPVSDEVLALYRGEPLRDSGRRARLYTGYHPLGQEVVARQRMLDWADQEGVPGLATAEIRWDTVDLGDFLAEDNWDDIDLLRTMKIGRVQVTWRWTVDTPEPPVNPRDESEWEYVGTTPDGGNVYVREVEDDDS